MADPELHFTADVEEYAAAVVPFLEAQPCSRNILRGVIETARASHVGWTGPPSFWWVTAPDGVIGAVSWSPPYGLLVSSLPATIAPQLIESAIARAAALGHTIAGVNGPSRAAEAVAAAWQGVTGGSATVTLSQLLHVLGSLSEPARPEGRWRRAGSADVDMCTDWLGAFAAEARVSAGGDPRASTELIAGAGRLFLWEVDGVATSMVAHSPPVAGVARIGPVYTPAGQRTRGFARRLTYEASREALSQPGVTSLMLYTDAANPTSNSIYRQIGYQPVEEHLAVLFCR